MSDDEYRPKRRRVRSPQPPKPASDEEDDNYVPYVPVAQRREEKFAKLQSWGVRSGRDRPRKPQDDAEEKEAELKEEELRREKARRERTLLLEAQDVHKKKAAEDAKKTVEEKTEEAEAELLEAIKSRRKLASDMELAKGISYSESMKTNWRPPKFVRDRTPEENDKIREKYHILVEGDDIPPPIESFRVRSLSSPLDEFQEDHKSPHLFQLQGIPAAFAGRDIIGIAFTGSGKTLAFCLPLIMTALEEETKLPFVQGEGPVGIILCPSRELANQTFENIGECEQSHTLNKGIHIVVATPGRLIDMLEKKRFNFNNCKYLCMDEADRMIDLGFEDDVRNIMSFFTVTPTANVLFSATMPRKIQDFARESLIKPVLVNVGRAGAANLDQEAKMVYLLECLQKTPPPNEVDDIQEYLLLKGVEAVAIHGSKTQEERQYAIKAFKSGAKDVMVASGVASKVSTFNDIQHVIIYSMPKEIEDYWKTGIATTFVNMNTPEQTLLDLKYLLLEAGQKVPPFLASVEDPRLAQGRSVTGCPVCGGLGHSISNCPKLEDTQRRTMASHRMEDTGGY
ncbi:DEAD-box protein abstrakt [Ephemerocybe angulata]|uniref:RNA helicase n=1 Tax=Ephemerocybe angulata TaxID=980116 RepID=A0A8H6HAQ4_9AGAR|nr:DEAD-box protein abstrakt [Tulosesus angulatus]